MFNRCRKARRKCARAELALRVPAVSSANDNCMFLSSQQRALRDSSQSITHATMNLSQSSFESGLLTPSSISFSRFCSSCPDCAMLLFPSSVPIDPEAVSLGPC